MKRSTTIALGSAALISVFAAQLSPQGIALLEHYKLAQQRTEKTERIQTLAVELGLSDDAKTDVFAQILAQINRFRTIVLWQ